MKYQANLLSSNMKKSPLLWLDDNLHLCPSSLYIRSTKNITVKWFGNSFGISIINTTELVVMWVLFKSLDDGCSSI